MTLEPVLLMTTFELCNIKHLNTCSKVVSHNKQEEIPGDETTSAPGIYTSNHGTLISLTLPPCPPFFYPAKMCSYFINGELCYLSIRIFLKRCTSPKIATTLLVLVDWVQLQHHWRQRGIRDKRQNGNLYYVVRNRDTLER